MVKNPSAIARDIRDFSLIPGLGRSSGGGHDNPLKYSCLENPMDAGDLGLIPGSVRSSEKEMATHSSILAWRIPRTEEPGRLQSMGSQELYTT